MVLALDLALLGLGLLASLLLFGEAPSEIELSSAALWAEVLITFTLVGLVPFAWTVGTRIGGLDGALEYLGMETRKFKEGLGPGALWALFLLGVVLSLSFLLSFVAGDPEESPLTDALLAALTWPLVVALSLGAGVGEEILYRGLLQRWFIGSAARMGARPQTAAAVGIGLQAVVFGFSHAGYDTVLNILVPLVIGVLFGVLYHKRGNLYLVMVAHFLYDLFLLGLAMLFPEVA